MDRKKLVQKFHDEDKRLKESLGKRSSFKYRKKQKMLRRLEGKDYQALRVNASGRSADVKVSKMDSV